MTQCVKVLVFESQDWWKEKNQLPKVVLPPTASHLHSHIYYHSSFNLLYVITAGNRLEEVLQACIGACTCFQER